MQKPKSYSIGSCSRLKSFVDCGEPLKTSILSKCTDYVPNNSIIVTKNPPKNKEKSIEENRENELDERIREIIESESELEGSEEKLGRFEDRLADMFDTFMKTKEKINSSFDSKDTISIAGSEDNELHNVFGGDIDIDQLIRRHQD